MNEKNVLSYEQERLWFLHQMNPDNPANNRPCLIRISGILDEKLLRMALNRLVYRHSIIRAHFPQKDGVPYQLIHPYCELPIELIDFLSWSEEDRQIEIDRMIQKEIRKPFRIDYDMLIRIKILRTQTEEHLLLITIHHIIFDGWSLTCVLQEVESDYQALVGGIQEPPKELSYQYIDYAREQRDAFASMAMREKMSFWCEKLSGELPLLELPLDRPRSQATTLSDGFVHFMFTVEETMAIKTTARRERATPFMVLLTALKILLYRYAGQEDIIVGSMVSGRKQAETSELIGLFVNTLVLRTSLSGNITFREAVRRVKKTALDGYEHQDVPFAKLVSEINPPRIDSRNPFFQVMINMHNMPKAENRVSGLFFEDLEVSNGVDQLDLTLKASEKDGQLHCEFIYNQTLFEQATIKRMSGHLKNILASGLAHPEETIECVPLLSQEEKRQLLFEFSGTTANYPDKASLQQLFEEQVEKAPDAVALVCQNKQLTYRELNKRANKLSHYLKSLGVGYNDAVGVCLERSMSVIISFVAILKAGGLYVPLDPKYPAERLQYMAEQSKLKIVLNHIFTSTKIQFSGVPSVYLDRLQHDIDEQKEQNPARLVSGESLAYIMFTSGSTGKPKPVAVTNKGIIRLVFNPGFDFLDKRQVFLQLSSTAFDFSTFEIYGALLHGARLAIIDSDMPSIEHIGEALKQYGVTTLCLGPEVLGLLTKEQIKSLAKVEQVLCGGDVLPVNMALDLLRHTDCRLINIYGPTENTVCTTFFEVTKDWPENQPIPVGRPVCNDRVYILDHLKQQVPIGIAGELYVSGPGLAAGYFHNEEQTRGKFVINPFGEEGSRLYRTGDIVKFLFDGNIAFLGRNDHQVKIHGCRIELGEIETILCSHPDIVQAVVIAKIDGFNMKALHAYMVAVDKKIIDNNELRDFLKSKLPNYMVPSFFYFLSKFPLTPVGKVDRAKLQNVKTLDFEQTRPVFVKPITETEREMVTIWEDILSVRPISTTDSFFDLGGHSLLAMQLMAEVEKKFSKRIPVSMIFTADTIRKMCAALGTAEETEMFQLIPLQPNGSKAPLFCIHAGDGGVVSYGNLIRYFDDKQPIYGIALNQAENFNIEMTTIEVLAEQYIKKIRSVDPVGPYYLAGHSFGGIVAYEMGKQLMAHGYPVALLILFDAWNPARFPDLKQPKKTIFFERWWYSIQKFIATPFDNKKAYLQERLKKEIQRLCLLMSPRKSSEKKRKNGLWIFLHRHNLNISHKLM